MATSVLFAAILIYSCKASAQTVSERFANNATSVQWIQTETPHFTLVLAEREKAAGPMLAQQAEQIYSEYERRMGTAPEHITLYYNDSDELVSAIRARQVDDSFSIWTGDPFKPAPVPGIISLNTRLRLEIGYAFQEHVQSFPIDYVYYLFARHSKSPWSEGLASYLAVPERTPYDRSVMRNYWGETLTPDGVHPPMAEWSEMMLGRSQLHFFNELFSDDSLAVMYSHRESLLGTSYFNFNPAFEKATAWSYELFDRRWRAASLADFRAGRPGMAAGGVSLLPGRRQVLNYLGAAVRGTDGAIATISFTSDGSKLQQLSLSQDGRTQLIRKGYFQPEMDWHSDGTLLAFAQNVYSDDGHFFTRLFSWNARTNTIERLTDQQNVQLPAFEPAGQRLAYVQKTATQQIIWLRDLQTGRRRDLHAFARPVSVSHLDYHPTRPLLLVSYRGVSGDYRTGIVNIEDGDFQPLPRRGAMPLQARWSPGGSAVYYNGIEKEVPNIFRARWEQPGMRLADPRLVTSDYYGLRLADVAQGPAGEPYVLARRGGTFTPGKLIQFAGGDGWDGPEQSGGFDAAADTTAVPADTKSQDSARSASGTPYGYRPQSLDFSPYNTFSHIQWEPPIFVPFYLNPGDFGLGGMVQLAEPTRTHELDFYGLVSLPDPWHKSYFYADYVNNMFRPRLELEFNHLSSASGFFGKSQEVKAADVVALSSLWKLSGTSYDYSNWYAGLTLRHMAFDYFPEATLRRHHPEIYFDNRATRQTDLKLMLSWRNLEPSRHTFIHPADGEGIRLSATASDKILGSAVRYARISLDGYTVLPGPGDHRLYLYANGVLDLGEPAGRDYLSFSNDGDYQLPGENFMGSVNPAFDRFVRGYREVLTGDRFLFGTVEYRIPFQFETNRALLGILPPARSSLTFFADAGIMGNARVSSDRETLRSRYSAGIELKRVLAIGDSFKLAYELGLAQPLNRSLGPVPYYNIKTAIPF